MPHLFSDSPLPAMPFAQVPLQGAETLNQPDFPALGVAEQRRPSAFGGKLLPERGLLANVLLAGLLGLGAGAGARNPLEAAARGGLAPFQFKLGERARQRREEEQDLQARQREEQISASQAATAEAERRGGILESQEDRAKVASFLQNIEQLQRISNAPEKHDVEVLAATGQFIKNSGGQVFTAEQVKNLSPEDQEKFRKRGSFLLPGGQTLLFEDPNEILPAQRIERSKAAGGPFTLPAAKAKQQHAILLSILDIAARQITQNATGNAAKELGQDLAAEVLGSPSNIVQNSPFPSLVLNDLFTKARKRGYNGETIAAALSVTNAAFAGLTSAQAPGVQTPLLDLPPGAPDKAQDIARGRKGLVLSGLAEGVIAKLRADNSALADFIQLDPNKPGQGKLNIQGPLTEEALARIREILLESGITVE